MSVGWGLGEVLCALARGSAAHFIILATSGEYACIRDIVLRGGAQAVAQWGGGGSGQVPSEEPCGWRWVLLSCP